MTNIQHAALFGLIGGLGAEIAGLYNLRKLAPSQYPHYIKSFWRYWVPTFLMCLMGAVFAVGYVMDGTNLGTILTLNVGASAPLLIGTMTKQTPNISE